MVCLRLHYSVHNYRLAILRFVMFVKVCISFVNFCYVSKSMYFLRKFAQYPSNLILPAKDELFSLNRLSSRGL